VVEGVPLLRVPGLALNLDRPQPAVRRLHHRLGEHQPGLLGPVPRRAHASGGRAEVDRLNDEIGGLPYAFAASLSEVGGVSFTGDCPALALYYNNPGRPRPTAMPPGAPRTTTPGG